MIGVLIRIKHVVVFVWVDALHSSEQFFSHVGTFSLVEPIQYVLLNDLTLLRWWVCVPIAYELMRMNSCGFQPGLFMNRYIY